MWTLPTLYSLCLPGYVARLSSATATASSWAAAGNRIATNSRQMTRLALGFSSSSSGGGRHSIATSSVQGGGGDGEGGSSNNASPLSGGGEGSGLRHSEGGWSLSLRSSSVDAKEKLSTSECDEVAMTNGDKTIENGIDAKKEDLKRDSNDKVDSGTDSNGLPSPRQARTASLGSSTFSSYS